MDGMFNWLTDWLTVKMVDWLLDWLFHVLRIIVLIAFWLRQYWQETELNGTWYYNPWINAASFDWVRHYLQIQIIYKCVYNRVYYILHKMQFKESASPERNLILAFENAA